jgi:hypothetical protein
LLGATQARLTILYSRYFQTSSNNQVDIARLLIDRGADIHAHYGNDRHTVLHLAVLHQDGEMTKLLLDNNADPNIFDGFAYTPLHISIIRERAPYSPFIKSYYGLNNLEDRQVSIESIKYLLLYGADINAIGGNINRSDYNNGTYLSGLDNTGQEGTAITFTTNTGESQYLRILNIKDKYLEARKILKKAGDKHSSCKQGGYHVYHNICTLND